MNRYTWMAWVCLAGVVCAADISDKANKINQALDRMRSELKLRVEKQKAHLRAYNSDTSRAVKGTIDRTQKELVRTTGKGEYRYKSDDAKRDYLQERQMKTEELRLEIVEGVEGKLDESLSPKLDMPLQAGAVGRLQLRAAEVIQVIDKSRCLLKITAVNPGTGAKQDSTTVLLRGMSMEGVVDDATVDLPGVFIVAGTSQYATAIGGSRTVFVIEPVDLEAKPAAK